MAGVLEGVNRRTQLVGQNRLELLLFRLGGTQPFAINVFKVREVIPCPRLQRMPNSHPVVCGIANLRGKTVSVIDLAMAIGRRAQDLKDAFIIVTEFNRNIQGFLVSSVERIVNMNWEAILPPPKGTDKGSYLTAVTNVDGQLVEIVDVEKVLEMVIGSHTDVSDSVTSGVDHSKGRVRRVLVADDSSVARKQVQRALEQIGVESVLVIDGKQALKQLREWADQGVLDEQISMIISDIEMPEMDGYTLTAEIRRDPRLGKLHILLHSSLSGGFNQAMIEKVGANAFLPKFKPDELAAAVIAYIQSE
jgi:two-component system chemotaxis response regulator CheV